jgi:hypothetical protein
LCAGITTRQAAVAGEDEKAVTAAGGGERHDSWGWGTACQTGDRVRVAPFPGVSGWPNRVRQDQRGGAVPVGRVAWCERAARFLLNKLLTGSPAAPRLHRDNAQAGQPGC